MTAVTLAVQPEARRGFILSDCAVFDADGILRHKMSKIVHGHQFPWAAAVSGNVAPSIVADQLADVRILDVDQLAITLPRIIRAVAREAAEQRGVFMADVLIQAHGIAWNAREDRPQGFFVTSGRNTVQGQHAEPYTWYEQAWASMPSLPAGLDATFGRPVDLTSAASFDPETDGVTLLEAQRASPFTNLTPNDAAPGGRIGCEVDMTIVTEHGFEIWGIHQWPDAIGQRLAGSSTKTRQR